MNLGTWDRILARLGLARRSTLDNTWDSLRDAEIRAGKFQDQANEAIRALCDLERDVHAIRRRVDEIA